MSDQIKLTSHQSQYYAWLLTRHAQSGSIESLASTLVDAQVDLNPHQVDAALFACKNPLSHGVILADEVGLGKTIEAGLVILQRWAERKRRILIITPANLRKQWHQELQEKFGLQCEILESKNYNNLKKQGKSPFELQNPIICSYQFAKSKANDIKKITWDLVILDEAHRLRNVYKKGNIIAKTLKKSLSNVASKILLTATPLQNSLLELYGLVSIIDERVFGNIESFRTQFGNKLNDETLEKLRQRLAPVCQRTLRRQVQAYVAYTKRYAIVQEFTPSMQEKELAERVAEYLRRPNLQALPEGQRKLISLVLWKLLASSSRAIAGALGTILKRLEGILAETPNPDLIDTLDEDYESLGETAEEWQVENLDNKSFSSEQYQALVAEIEDLKQFKALAESIQQDAKSDALLSALKTAFDHLQKTKAPQKAIIFTESKRTQDYLLQCLSNTFYAGENGESIILFNGTNSDKQAQTIYKNWLKRHEGTDKITGSKTADTRAALVEYFKEKATIMIATEAGAEGINLQFCSLIINYDLPWNPQRIEQRIGRCHRYGQKNDVVVVNFVDRNNEADARVYELLAEKFQLFDGVFGVSDEVLGAIGSGVDIERRIAEIYRGCRQPEEIKAAFDQLQQELSGEISQAMMQTRQTLLENFDESVREKLRICDEKGKAIRSKYERLLLTFTQSELGKHAHFDTHGFILHSLPNNLASHLQNIVPIGRYELPRQSGQGHLYRLQHPLAKALLTQAKERTCLPAKLVFNYSTYGSKISTLEPYIGQKGQLIATLLSITALNNTEEYLIINAITDKGEILIDDDPEKLLQLPVIHESIQSFIIELPPDLLHDYENKKVQSLSDMEQRNLGYFDQEVQKLNDWEEDYKYSLELQLKSVDNKIAEIKRSYKTATTAKEKAEYLQQHDEQEEYREKLRTQFREERQIIKEQRRTIIKELQQKNVLQFEEKRLFNINWEIV